MRGVGIGVASTGFQRDNPKKRAKLKFHEPYKDNSYHLTDFHFILSLKYLICFSLREN